MYHILIVDDEQPTVRFIHSIIKQFCPDFHVVGTASSGELALDFLQKQPVDLLITDISMHGMNGIQLAQFARDMYPDIHILIISGYGEFEYAQGAIRAGVEEYLLKPISIPKVTDVLQRISQKLASRTVQSTASILPALACGQSVPDEAVRQLYGATPYRFALLRFGNMDMLLPKTLEATAFISHETEDFQLLQGRDKNEQILVAQDNGLEDFLTHLSSHMISRGDIATWTAIYTPSFQMIEDLPTFIRLAMAQLHEQTIIGRHQILRQSGSTASERIQIPAAELKQLGSFLSFGNTKLFKDSILSLSDTWTQNKIPQRHVWHMGRQIIHQAASVSTQVSSNQEDILLTFNDLTREVGSCQELMEQLYSLLVEEFNIRTQKMSPQELYDYTANYVRENYAQPLSMQSTCDEIGISQTYLSRLFRKYSDTTFNAFLTQCRMEASMALLQKNPDMLLRDVAICVGYEDASYFAKVFRQYTGKTPSQWVKKV